MTRPPLSKELWFSEDPEVATKLVFKDVSEVTSLREIWWY